MFHVRSLQGNSAAPFVFQNYDQATSLYFAENTLTSEQGIQQGDPLGPLLYSLVTLSQRSSSRSISCCIWTTRLLEKNLNSVYDGVLFIKKKSHPLGLELNHGKCVIFLFGGTANEQQGAREKLLSINKSVSFS